jgi:hypothetical protein
MFRNGIQLAQSQSDEARAEMQKMLATEQNIEEERAISAAKRAVAESLKPGRSDHGKHSKVCLAVMG